MIVIRFKVKCKPEKLEALRTAFSAVVTPSQAVEGVVHFDIAQDITNPNSFIATEVFADQAARARQESQPEVQRVMALLPEAVTGPPEMAAYDVSLPHMQGPAE